MKQPLSPDTPQFSSIDPRFETCCSFSVYNLVQGACVYAKLLQSCLTLGNPMNCSPPGSSVHGILQAKIWSRLPCPPSGDLLNPGIEPMSLMTPVLAGGFFTISATLEAPYLIYFILTQTSGWCLHFASDLTLDPPFKYSRSLHLHSSLSN